MGAVEENERPPADRFEAALPACFADGLKDLGLVKRLPNPRQDLRRRDGRRGVRALMEPGQGGRKGIAAALTHVGEPETAAPGPGLERPPGAKDLGQGRAPFAGDPADLPERHPSPNAADNGDAGLDDPGFLEGDLPERRAEMLLVVPGDRGDDRDERADDVGRVEPAAHPDLEDRDVDPALGELHERKGRQDLEVGRVIGEPAFGHQAVDHGLQLREPRQESRRRDRSPVDTDPLLDSGEVRRRIEPRPEPVRPRDPVQHGRDRAFAVRPGHVDGEEAVLRVAQGRAERRDVLEAELDPEMLEAAEIVPALGRGH